MIKILLVDDHKIIRDGIKFYFKDHPKYTVAHEAQDGLKALELLDSEEIDLVITDISMPRMDGLQLINEVRKTKPELPFIALSMMDDYDYIKKMLDANVNGYVLKTCSESEILEAVECVLNGEPFFSAEVNKILVKNMMAGKDEQEEPISLSNRERQVLKLVLEQFSNQEIATQLYISVRTVDSHKRNMIEKTGSKNIAGLIRYALEHNILAE